MQVLLSPALSRRLDRIAIGLSALCVVHCVATAALVAGFALAGSLLSHEIHSIALAVAVVLGVVALGGGALRHGRIEPCVIGGAGLGLMGAALTLDHGPAEMWTTLAGVSLLALAHYRNGRITG